MIREGKRGGGKEEREKKEKGRGENLENETSVYVVTDFLQLRPT